MKSKKIRKYVWLSNGKKISRSFTRKTDAENWHSRIKLELERNYSLGIEPIEEITFYEVSKKWLDLNQGQLARKSFSDYRSILHKHLYPLMKDGNMSSLSISTGESLLVKLNTQNLSAKTINKIFMVLKSIIKYSIHNNYLVRDPLLRLKLPKEKQRNINILEQDEIEKLLNTSKGLPEYGIILIALNHGLRLGEILGLMWDCIDFKNNRINVMRSQDKVQIKENTKNGKIRFIPMNEVVKTFLFELRIKQQNPFYGYVFSNHENRPWNTDHFKKRYFDPILKKAGVKQIRFHDLRHTFASHFVMKGGAIFDLQKLLGHQDIAHTMIYAHYSEDHLSKASKIISFKPNNEMVNSNFENEQKIMCLPR